MATYLLPKAFVDGDYLTFTELNAAMGNNGNIHWLRNALAALGIDSDTATQTVDSAIVGCRILGGQQQIPDSQWTEIAWTQQRWGRWDGEDVNYLLSDRPTFVHLPTRPNLAMDGYWLIGAHIVWEGNSTGERRMQINSHGNKIDLTSQTPLAEKQKAATGTGLVMGMSLITLDAFNAGGGSYSVTVWQNSGDALGLQLLPGASPEIWMVKLASTSAA